MRWIANDVRRDAAVAAAMANRLQAAIDANLQPEPPGARAVSAEQRGRLHRVEVFAASHARIAEVLREPQQIPDRGEQPGVADNRGRVDAAITREMKSPVVAVISAGMLLRDRDRTASKRGLRHAEGAQDVRGGEVAEGLSADPGDDAPEHVVAAVVVAELAGRREIEASLPGEGPQDVFVDIDARRRRRRELDEQERVAETGRVRQQVPNGDAILTVHPLRQVLPHFVVQRQLALFGEKHDAERRKRLRDRRGIEDGRRGDRDLSLEVGHPVAALEHHRPVPGHADAAAGRVWRAPLGKQRVDRRIGHAFGRRSALAGVAGTHEEQEDEEAAHQQQDEGIVDQDGSSFVTWVRE